MEARGAQEGAEDKINLADITNSQLAYYIDEYIHNERSRNILKRRLIDGYTFAQLADTFYPLSERQLKNIVYKEQRALFKHMKA